MGLQTGSSGLRTKKRVRILENIFVLLLIFTPAFAQCATQEVRSEEPAPSKDRKAVEEKYGIQIKQIRLTAAGRMLDFRYKVVDPEKASLLTDRQIQPTLIDQATGKKLSVPRTRLGPMRQTSVKPTPDRDYFVLFGNQNNLVRRGSLVTVVIGDFRIENLTVE